MMPSVWFLLMGMAGASLRSSRIQRSAGRPGEEAPVPARSWRRLLPTR